MSAQPRVRVELRACAACGAVVMGSERHRDWHAAIRAGAGRPLALEPDYELIGFIDGPPKESLLEEDLLPGEDLLLGEELHP